MSQSHQTPRWIADLALLATACMWGINIPIVKFAISDVEPLVFNALRMVLSALTLGILAAAEYHWANSRKAKGQKDLASGRDMSQLGTSKGGANRFAWGRVLAFSLFSGLCYPLLFMFGIERATAANTALLMASMPMWTAILSRMFLAERLRQVTWIGLIITMIGTAIVTSAKGQLDFSTTYLVGNLLILAAAATWASATVISRPLMKSVSPLLLAALSAAFTVPIHLLIVSSELVDALPLLNDRRILLSLVYSGVFSTGIAYASWNFGVHRLGGSHASVYQNVVTLVAVMGGWLVLRETPLVAQILGGIVTIIGLLVMRRGR